MTRREYVSRKRRDGKTQKSASTPSFDMVELEECMKRGASAARRGLQRYENPFIGTRARAWTFAWEDTHLKMLGKKTCLGCTFCFTGTKYRDSFREWMKAWHANQKGDKHGGAT